jgi:multicomponent Na+:H+ antiporter subunit F
VSEWLIAAFVLIAGLLPCGVVCVRGSPSEALVALELASVLAVLAVMVLAEGLQREWLIDLAVVLTVVSFAGNLAYARFLEREPEAAGGG